MGKLTNGLNLVQNAWTFNLLTAAFTFRTQAFRMLLAAACAGLSIGIAAITLIMAHPAQGEIIQNLIIRAGAGIMIFGLVFFGAFLIIQFFRSAQTVAREEFSRHPKVSLLQAGWIPGDISPDNLILCLPGADKNEFRDRVSAAKENATPGSWVLVLEYQNPAGAIYTQPGKPTIVFTREDPPFQGPDWPENSRIVPANTWFTDETPAEFRRYVENFIVFFREWSPRKKLAIAPDRAERTVWEYTSVLIFAFVLFSGGISAQKSVQVEDALGTKIRQIPHAGVQVTYEFERTEIQRTADGKKDYVRLLTNAPMYRDAGGGKFVALHADEKIIVRADAVEEVSGREMRPRSQGSVKTDAPVDYSMPDSLELVETLDRAKRSVSFYKSEFWRTIRPIWQFVMFAFWALFPVLAVAGLILWFWARLSASEEIPGIHWYSSRALVILVGIVWTIGVINAMMTVVYLEPPTFFFLLCTAGIGIAAWKTAAWIVPNLNARPGGRTAFYRGGQDRPMLNG